MTRIIAGVAGSLRLEVPKTGTRPTSDRVREAIFSSLESWGVVSGARVLDLYAGSGALGLEAVSRGASAATLVERHPGSARIVERNARTVLGAFSRSRHREKSAPRVDVVRQAVQTYLNSENERTDGVQPLWDVVLLDPPYELGEDELATNLETLVPLLAPGAVVLVERSTRAPAPQLPEGLAPIRDRRYGETALWWSETIAD